MVIIIIQLLVVISRLWDLIKLQNLHTEYCCYLVEHNQLILMEKKCYLYEPILIKKISIRDQSKQLCKSLCRQENLIIRFLIIMVVVVIIIFLIISIYTTRILRDLKARVKVIITTTNFYQTMNFNRIDLFHPTKLFYYQVVH